VFVPQPVDGIDVLRGHGWFLLHGGVRRSKRRSPQGGGGKGQPAAPCMIRAGKVSQRQGVCAADRSFRVKRLVAICGPEPVGVILGDWRRRNAIDERSFSVPVVIWRTGWVK
jgi:hypothetical protein